MSVLTDFINPLPTLQMYIIHTDKDNSLLSSISGMLSMQFIQHTVVRQTV